jgi:hypothetical protein
MVRTTALTREPARPVVWFVRVAAGVGFLVWFFYLALWTGYDYTRPTVMQPSLGRQYALETHGHTVYLTHHEVFTLHTLGEVGMGLVIVAAVVGLISKRRLRSGD